MSADIAAVRFPDGEVRWTLHTVVDTLGVALSPTLQPVRDAWHAWADTAPDPAGPVYEVDVYSDYGRGASWRGTATRNRLLNGWDRLAVDDDDDEGIVWGRAEWFLTAHESARSEAE